MKYESSSAFRRALEDRLRSKSLQTGLPLSRLRKMVVFDRFLARLILDQPANWVLKGGLALQLRLQATSRTTKDIDMLMLDDRQDLQSLLSRAGSIDLGDWFLFEVGRPEIETEETGSARYPLLAFLDSRPFETFHMDVGLGDLLIEPPDLLATPDLLAFADISPTLIPCYPLTQQIAEKLHAYTRPHVSGENSRVKDFVDMILMAGLAEIQAVWLLQALTATFIQRGTHPLPERLPLPPEKWRPSYTRMAGELGLDYIKMEDGFFALQKFLDPVLANESIQTWNPASWEWQR